MVQSTHSSAWRRFWKPAVATGTIGTALAVWFEELVFYVQEILALIFLPILASLLYLFNHRVFTTHQSRPEDLLKSKDEKE